jgi:ribosomal protein S20
VRGDPEFTFAEYNALKWDNEVLRKENAALRSGMRTLVEACRAMLDDSDSESTYIRHGHESCIRAVIANVWEEDTKP